jgi:hypothetical protein
MAEFLARGLNVAMPEVDLGDDVFVVRAEDEQVTRVQVKTGNGTVQADKSYFAQFNIPWDQLTRLDTPTLVYVLAVRYLDRWTDFIVIRRSTLRQFQADQGVGTIVKDDRGQPNSLVLRLVCTTNDVQNKKVSFQSYRNAFERPGHPRNRRPPCE